jgi:hypothetical protein
VWAAPDLLGAPTIGGGVPGPGGGGRGDLRSQISLPSCPKYMKTAKKTGGFTHVLAYKSPKTPFFAQKYFTRYTHETFFEIYVNFQNHFLSHCGVIPVQSFGSHICPQPHGLGLTFKSAKLCQTFMTSYYH